MKKSIFIGSLVVLTAGMFSCKKEYTCNCTATTYQEMQDTDGTPLMAPQTSTANSSSVIKDKEDEAKSKCSGQSSVTESTTSNGSYQTYQKVTTTCSI